MAWRKGKGEQAQQVEQVQLHAGETVVSESIVEERPGETHVHRTVREWHPHAPERLSEIEAVIDSWGRRAGDAPSARRLDPAELQARVDRITRRVKGTRKVVVQETVTEWVERPAKPKATYTPVEPVHADEADDGARSAQAAALRQTLVADDTVRASRPKKFRILGFLGTRPAKAAKPVKAKKPKPTKKEKSRDTSDPDYQPQCAALTEDGQQCRNSARGVSRYCSSHKGYQPPTAKGLAKRIEGESWDPKDDVTDHQSVRAADTRPVVRKAKDTKVKVRKAAKKASRKTARRTRRKR